MLNQIILSLAPAGLAFVLSLLITPLVINLAWKWGLIDNPQTHKHAKVIHERPTPRSGGIAIFASFLITILVFLPLDEKVIGILAGSLVIIVMGTIDDAILASGKKDFHPLLRLAIQFASAAIPVFVGGIGIFSVMQISISERTYEIGLRKSIGATDPEIFGQFLIESVSLSLVGGLVGAALGYGITMLAAQAFPDGLSVSPVGLVLAAAFAIVIGLAAGVYPALRASRLTPVDAIHAG